MGIRDQRIDWIRKRLWLPPEVLHSVNMATGQAYETAGITPVEVTDVGMGTWIMTDGEFINGYMPCPCDLDPSYPVGYRVAWTLDASAGSASVEWILLTGLEKVGQAISLPATVLNTPFVLPTLYKDDSGDVTAATDFLLQWTSRGIDNLIGLTRDNIEDGAFLTYKLEMNAGTNETTCHYIGMEMDYVPMKTQGEGSHIDKPLKTSGVE